MEYALSLIEGDTMTTVARCIEATENRLKGLLESGEKTQEELDKLNGSLDMTFREWVSLQELKSAFSGSRLSKDAAVEVYGLLGNSVDHVNGLSLATKIVLTEIHHKLLAETN